MFAERFRLYDLAREVCPICGGVALECEPTYSHDRHLFHLKRGAPLPDGPADTAVIADCPFLTIPQLVDYNDGKQWIDFNEGRYEPVPCWWDKGVADWHWLQTRLGRSCPTCGEKTILTTEGVRTRFSVTIACGCVAVTQRDVIHAVGIYCRKRERYAADKAAGRELADMLMTHVRQS